MEEETVIEQSTTEEVAEQSADYSTVEPAEQTTQETEEPEQTSETEPAESEETETPEKELTGIEKALKDTKAQLTKLQQERAEEKRQQEQREQEQKKTQVETGDTLLRQEYNAIVYNMKQEKASLAAQALENFKETGDERAYHSYLLQLDAWYEEAKTNLDGNYRYAETELQKQKRELAEQTNQRAIATFKETEKEFCEKHPKVIDKYLELGYDPQDLPVVKELLSIALAEQDTAQKTQEILTSENNEAKGKLVSIATNQSQSNAGNDSIPRTWDEIVDKMDADPKWYERNLDKILEMRSQGQIT